MRLALMADIHANREAFEACLADAEAKHAERIVFLGDYVNYGADPEWVVGVDHGSRREGPSPSRSRATTTPP